MSWFRKRYYYFLLEIEGEKEPLELVGTFAGLERQLQRKYTRAWLVKRKWNAA